MEPAQRVVTLDTHSHLPLAMHQLYLADVQAWVVATCRRATNRLVGNMLDALFARGGCADLARWQWIGPHAALRSEYRLSQDAIAILLLAAAPKLWGNLSFI
jgi:hypothetical protein